MNRSLCTDDGASKMDSILQPWIILSRSMVRDTQQSAVGNKAMVGSTNVMGSAGARGRVGSVPIERKIKIFAVRNTSIDESPFFELSRDDRREETTREDRSKSRIERDE